MIKILFCSYFRNSVNIEKQNIMKKTFGLFIIIISIISCKDNPNKGTDKEMIGIDTFKWEQYKTTYSYKDLEENIIQKLGINWITEDSINYQFYIGHKKCDMELHGAAKTIYPDADYEIDEDGGYPAKEYIHETDEYVVSIRIAVEDRSKARFIFSSMEENKCATLNDIIMKIEN